MESDENRGVRAPKLESKSVLPAPSSSSDVSSDSVSSKSKTSESEVTDSESDDNLPDSALGALADLPVLGDRQNRVLVSDVSRPNHPPPVQLGKHYFPFRTVKSYPGVFSANYRDTYKKMQNKAETLKTADPVESTPQLSKHELLEKIGQIDSKIVEVEKKIAMLQKMTKDAPKVSAVTWNMEMQSLSERIFSENRAKAESSHREVAQACGEVQDLSGVDIQNLEVIKKNAKKYQTFRPHLIKYLRRIKLSEKEAETRRKEDYDAEMVVWQECVNEIEESSSHKKNEADGYALFEKEFPKLQQDRERWAAMRSETVQTRNQPKDYNMYLREKMTVTTEEMRRRAAAIPSLQLGVKRPVYRNDNGRIRGDESRDAVPWSNEEKETFKKMYLERPKDFTYVSTFLPMRSVSDCIEFYYKTKKNMNYKDLVLQKDGRKLRGVRTERRGSADSLTRCLINASQF